MSRRGPVIAIDGAAGSGKSTLARRLAETLDLPYLNTGMMYRAVTLESVEKGLDPENGPALASLVREMTFDLDTSVRPAQLSIEGAAPDPALSSPEVESRVSRVARHPEVRAVLCAEQRRLSERGGVVEGRDIGTVVAPGAEVKIYLEADESERIARRTHERRATEEEIGRALSARDAFDAHTNPFEPAADAIAIDTTEMDEESVFRTVLDVVRARLAEAGR